MLKVRYFDIAWLSTVDGPGNRVVLFLQGCHLRCPWCHSPHSWETESPILFNPVRCINCYRCLEVCEHNVHTIIDGVHKLQRKNCTKCGKCIEVCPTSKIGHNTGALSLPTQNLDSSTVFQLLLPQLDVVKDCGGITLSGGEALVQKEATLEILKQCKSYGIHTAIETSLTLPAKAYSYVGDYVDCWLIGIRDVSLQGKNDIDDLILENIKYISSLNKETIIRYPVIKGFTDSIDQLDRILTFMLAGGFENIEILPCNRDMEHYYALSGIKPLLAVNEAIPTESELIHIADFFRTARFNVKVIK